MKFKDQKAIQEYIFDEFIYGKEFIATSTYINNLDLLCDNKKGVKMTFTGFTDVYPNQCQVAVKYACDFDKSLKDHLRTVYDKYDFINSPLMANCGNKIKEIAGCNLFPGMYFIQLSKKHDDFMVLKSDADEDCKVVCTVYFIGDRYLKYRDDFLKVWQEYKDSIDDMSSDTVCYDDFENYKDTVFKSFDYMVFNGKKKLINYIDNFFKNIPKYASYEMIPKLSILLYGNPGTGKSTFAKALAKYLNIHLVRCMTPGYFTDNDDDPKRPKRNTKWVGEFINVIDDIDCICVSRDEDKSQENLASNAALLEFLDNPGTMYYKADDGNYYQIAIVVATTNYYDRLDKAVVRTGRFDFQLEMKLFDKELAEKFCSLYDLKLSDVYEGDITPDFEIQPSSLQALCLKNIDKVLKEVK